MSGVFPYTDGYKRFHTLAYYYSRNGGRLYKAAIDGGFTCPNIDGTKGTGGCAFCGGGSAYFSCGGLSVTQQIALERERIRKKHPGARLTAYFQAHTNTYAPPQRLRGLYSEALACEGVDALSIATRADCLSAEICALLGEYAKKTRLTVELGLQTANDSVAGKMNRLYSFEEFKEGFSALRSRGIRVCVHIIDGLPGEKLRDMLYTAEELSKLRPDAVKIQLLHVIKGTPVEKMYLLGEYAPLTMAEYVEAVTEQLRRLPAETVIERITGDADKRTLAAPLWSLKKLSVINAVDAEMRRRNIYQSELFGVGSGEIIR